MEATDEIRVNSGSTVKDVAEYLGVPVPEVIKKLMTLGEMATLTQTLSDDVVTVLADALDALRAALSGTELLGQQLVDDQPGGIAERILGPLARAALENTLRRGQAALTGPVARGDAGAVAGHLNALAAVDARLAQAYRVNALRTAERAHAPEEVLQVLEVSAP